MEEYEYETLTDEQTTLIEQRLYNALKDTNAIKANYAQLSADVVRLAVSHRTLLKRLENRHETLVKRLEKQDSRQKVKVQRKPNAETSRQEMPLAKVIGAILYKRDGKVTFSEFADIMNRVRQNQVYKNNYHVNTSFMSIFPTIADNSDCMCCFDAGICVTEKYRNDLEKIKEFFYDQLTSEMQEIINDAC